jgi:hypothetical protein
MAFCDSKKNVNKLSKAKLYLLYYIQLFIYFCYLSIVTCISGYRRGVDWWLNLLNTYTQLITTSKYDSLTGLHTLNITVSVAHINSSMFLLVVSW